MRSSMMKTLIPLIPIPKSISWFRPLQPKLRFHTVTKNQIYNSKNNQNYTSAILLEKNLSPKIPSNNEFFRVTIFNEQGKISSMSQNIKKNQLVINYDMFPRDIRKLEKTPKTSSEITPTISVRKDCILIDLLNIRCLIKSNELLIFDDLNENSYSRSEFLNDLELKLTKKSDSIDSVDLPYEVKALESVLISIIKNLNSEMKVITTVTNGIINELEQDITRENLRFLLIQNKKISTFSRKVTLIRDCIDELLESDEDLADMYLTAKSHGHPRSIEDHQEVEFLLESYHAHLDEIVQTVNNCISNVRTTEEIINIILDSNRNQLMLLGLRFSIGLLSLGAGVFIASAYGMNLENFIEEEEYGMPLVVIISSLGIIGLFWYSIKNLKKLQKITMMGDHYRKH
ncbi:hypothetical protein WICMUC_002654 [Wickerhamomyces mucosus]|uniref:Magnesium transporter n=1 Tax=Wickerhamomyces mucosus TaxID=1378264 RepID=A0A9P8PPZ1_9ASCO|nr:hypothetical protein WICMUC_002654 [Wickerhamomyces mucosus]